MADGSEGGAPPGAPGIPGYTVLARLGEGGMGTVWRARRDHDGLEVALKVLAGGTQPFAVAARVRREREALALIDHPNVVRLHDHGTWQGCEWLALELLVGCDFAELIARRRRLGEAGALRVAIACAGALDHVHRCAGVLHRDVKPANLFLVGGGAASLAEAVKLIDFGLARSTAGDARLTREGLIVGTPAYMAPEQIRDEALGPQTDLYALGATLFHLLTGRVPYEAASGIDALRAHLEAPVPDPGALVPSLTAATRRLVMTALAKRPRDRHRDWSAFVAAVRAALEEVEHDRRQRTAPAPRRAVPTRTATVTRPSDPAPARGPYAALHAASVQRAVRSLAIPVADERLPYALLAAALGTAALTL